MIGGAIDAIACGLRLPAAIAAVAGRDLSAAIVFFLAFGGGLAVVRMGLDAAERALEAGGLLAAANLVLAWILAIGAAAVARQLLARAALGAARDGDRRGHP